MKYRSFSDSTSTRVQDKLSDEWMFGQLLLIVSLTY